MACKILQKYLAIDDNIITSLRQSNNNYCAKTLACNVLGFNKNKTCAKKEPLPHQRDGINCGLFSMNPV